MTSQEYENYVNLLSTLEDCELTKWEEEFVISLQCALEDFGTRARVSEQQQLVLDRMERKYLND